MKESKFMILFFSMISLLPLRAQEPIIRNFSTMKYMIEITKLNSNYNEQLKSFERKTKSIIKQQEEHEFNVQVVFTI
ncbi:MAG: hypothetical protein AAGK97_16435 [Bacteroidota bacterium]